jgi:hypothetical protein
MEQQTAADVPRYEGAAGEGVPEQVQRFAADGYLILDDLGLDDFDALAARIITDVDTRGLGDTRVQDAWLFSSPVKQLALAPRVLSVVEELYGRQPIAFQTLNFRRGTQQATHSDAVHFGSDPQGFMCGVWVALEDVDAENGALHYVVSSHRLPVYEPADFGLPGGRETYPEYERRIAALIEEQQLVRAEIHLRRGQAVVWAANLLHGGSPIHDPARTRRSQVTHYYFPGCAYTCPVMGDRDHAEPRRPVDIATGRSVDRMEESRSARLRTKVHESITWMAAQNSALGRAVHRRRYR